VPLTDTEYAPLAPEATLNDPAAVPPVTVQTGFEIRAGDEGDAEIVQPVSAAAKPEPEMETIVPGCPEVCDKLTEGGGVTMNDAPTISPVGEPVTATVYVTPTLAPDATVKDPETTPPDIVQTGFEIKPDGDEETVHVLSPAAKPEPAIETSVPADPDVGDNEILTGVTVKGALALSPVLPVTVTV
jgi:hypothetical protein